jgi:DNA-binding MarR family transcriptional regulator
MANHGDRHTQERFDWLHKIVCDHGLSPFTVRVGGALMTYINRKSGDAFPSQETLAGKVGATAEGVRLALKKLEERGYIAVERGRGRNVVNRYRLVLAAGKGAEKPQQPLGNSGAKTPTSVGDEPDRKPQPSLGSTPEKTPTAVGVSDEENPNGHWKKPQQRLGQNPLKEPTEGEIFSLSSDPPKKRKPKADPITPEIRAAFEEWWAFYPRKEGKKAALPAFAIAYGKAPLAAHMEAVKVYAAERAGKETKFTKLATTYLNGEHWNDERPTGAPPPPTSRGYHGRPEAFSGFDTAVEMAFDDYPGEPRR